MFYPLSKFVENFIWPESISLMLFFIALMGIYFHLRKLALITGALGFLILFIPSLPLVSLFIGRSLERHYPSRPIADYPEAEAIVVLGGTTATLQTPRWEAEEVSGSRLLPAARLYKAGKAKIVVASGGVPYVDIHGLVRTISEDMRDILIDEGVPKSAILIQKFSRNTREDARYTSDLLRKQKVNRILLVTSAAHLRRATRLFERSGLKVIPVPAGHRVSDGEWSWRWIVPDAQSLDYTTSVYKEYLGYLVDSVVK